MVMRLLYVFMFTPLALFCAEFTASVDRTQMNLGESFQLTLTLKEASARGVPSLQPLGKIFLINSQQQSSNTVIMNGQASTSTSWKFSLVAEGEGKWEIPPVSIETSEGKLVSAPIAIEVVKGLAAVTPGSSELEGVYLASEVSNDNPYKNEPFIYTVKLTSQRNLANLQLQKIEIEDAIVEVIGEPKVYDKVEKGMRVDIIEFSYLITPLKAGALKIPATVLQGGIPIKRRGYGGSLFDNTWDPISIMQGFDRLEPFTLNVEEKLLEVEPAILNLNPWLPARSLTIEEVLDPLQVLQEGEPFTRSFKIVAEGAKSGQLPSLNDLQFNGNLFKIYADNPQTGDEVKGGQVKSFRKEQYTFIPQSSGALTLPEVAVTWWDVVKKEKRVTKVPPRTLNVAPSVIFKTIAPVVEEAPIVLPQPIAPKQSPLLYIIIAGLTLLLSVATIFGIVLSKKIKKLKAGPVEKKKETPTIKKVSPKKDKKNKLPDLNPT